MDANTIALLLLVTYYTILVHNNQEITHFLLEAGKNHQVQRQSSVVKKKSRQNARFLPIPRHAWPVGALFD